MSMKLFARPVFYSLLAALFIANISSVAAAEGGDAHGPDGAKVEKEKKPKNIQDKIEAIRNRLEAAEQAIMNANKNKTCDGDGQCDIVEAGARNCGGPMQFIVVSEMNPKISEVKAKILEYTAVQKELNLVDPPTECPSVPHPVDGRCQKNLCTTVNSR
jgi:hypothetical protein